MLVSIGNITARPNNGLMNFSKLCRRGPVQMCHFPQYKTYLIFFTSRLHSPLSVCLASSNGRLWWEIFQALIEPDTENMASQFFNLLPDNYIDMGIEDTLLMYSGTDSTARLVQYSSGVKVQSPSSLPAFIEQTAGALKGFTPCPTLWVWAHSSSPWSCRWQSSPQRGHRVQSMPFDLFLPRRSPEMSVTW